MKQLSKLLIAYDGSACSDAALKDLKRAGLPAVVEAIVVTIANVLLPPAEEVPEEEVVSPGAVAMVRHTQAHAEEAVKKALAVAERGAHRVKTDFPDWSVRFEADGDSPAWAVIKMADSFGADLIVVGSHGHSSAGGRLILGSVSQRVLYDAPCSVRGARCSDKRREGPIRIVVGFSGSTESELAVAEAASRVWPAGSEARVVIAGDTLDPAILGVVSEKLRAAGLTTLEVNSDGDPASALLKEAEEWGADSIFVGTRDLHGLRHLLHGSVSAAVAARAQCSVEVARARRNVSLKPGTQRLHHVG